MSLAVSRNDDPLLSRKSTTVSPSHDAVDAIQEALEHRFLSRQDTFESEPLEFVNDEQETGQQEKHEDTPEKVFDTKVIAAEPSLTEALRPLSPTGESRRLSKVSLNTTLKLRHASSGGSSIAEQHILPPPNSSASSAMKPLLRKRRQKSVRLRKNTESSEELEEGAILRIRKTVVSTTKPNKLGWWHIL